MKAKHSNNLIAPPKIETLDPQPGELFWTRGGEESWNRPGVAVILTRSSTEVAYLVFHYYGNAHQKWSPISLGNIFRAECPSIKKKPRPQSWFLMQRLSDEDAATFKQGEGIQKLPRFFVEQQ